MDYLSCLRVFRAVAELRSFAAAARRLGVSRSVASKHVDFLERRIETRLLHRDPRHVVCTEAGQRFLAQIADVLDSLDRVESDLRNARALPAGTVRVGASADFMAQHIVPRLDELRVLLPGLVLDLRRMECGEPLTEQGIDLAIWIAPELESSAVVARRLASSAQVLCAAPRYLARRGVPGCTADLAEHVCLRCTSNPREWAFLDGEGPASRCCAEGTVRSDSVDVLRAAAVASAGIAQLPLLSVCEDLRAGRLVQVLADVALPESGVYAVYPTRRHLPAAVRAFMDFLGARLASTSDWSHCDRCGPMEDAQDSPAWGDARHVERGLTADPSPAG